MRRPRRYATGLSTGVVGALVLAIAASCRDATQVTVDVSSAERCALLSSVGLVVGPNPRATQQRFDQGFTTASTKDCNDATGAVGSLVVTPGGDSGSILVAVGVSVGGAPAPDAEKCADPNVAKSCIIARRAFAFIEHSTLKLPIRLDPLCIGQACDPASTCFKGTCVDATVTCNGTDCGLAEENPGGQGEAGGGDGASSDGRYDAELDGPGFEDVVDGATDGPVIIDGGPDADGSVGGPYPPCAMSAGIYYCSPGANGTVSGGACPGAPDSGFPACCRCTCPNGATATCSGSGACSNITPNCK